MTDFRDLIYIAGPLFNESELHFNSVINLACQCAGYDTYLPQRDGGIQTAYNGNEIFNSDCHYLDVATLMVANLDGSDVDSGTAWEIGYAYTRQIPIIGIRTDRRYLEAFSKVNLMIERSLSILCTTVPSLEEHLRRLKGSKS